MKKCAVVLLSGFLGSGKTTVLLHLLGEVPPQETVVVLMNEFGRIGVDGDIIRRDGLEILEVNRGSIFCACAKGDYLRALHTILRDYRPTVLLVEASGVADTRDMRRDLETGRLGDFYEFRGNLCVVDGEHFIEWADLFNAVSVQVETATAVVLNKTDLMTPEARDAVLKAVRALNPSAPLLETSFGRVPWAWALPPKETETSDRALPTDEEWDIFIQSRLEDEEGHLAPPDAFYAQSILWKGDGDAFRELLAGLPDDVVRAKGYFKERTGWTLFDVVHGGRISYAPLEAAPSSGENVAVFIRRREDLQELPKKLFAAGLKVTAIRN